MEKSQRWHRSFRHSCTWFDFYQIKFTLRYKIIFLTASFNFMQTAQKIDGKTLVVLAEKATREQYEACGLMTVADQLRLTTLVNAAADNV